MPIYSKAKGKTMGMIEPFMLLVTQQEAERLVELLAPEYFDRNLHDHVADNLAVQIDAQADGITLAQLTAEENFLIGCMDLE